MAGTWKQCCYIWNQRLEINLIAKFCEETKIRKFWYKNAVIIFDEKYCLCEFFGYNLKKTYCHIWNNHPWLCLTARYSEIMKILKFITKSALFGYFCARTLKSSAHISNQHLQISVTVKFCEETKMARCGGEKCLIWVFLTKRLSNPNCLVANFREKTKILKYGTKHVLFGYFWERTLKQLLSDMKSAPSTLSICKILQKNKNA